MTHVFELNHKCLQFEYEKRYFRVIFNDILINYDNVNRLFPYALFETLLPYLSPHHILKLAMVSKDLRLLIVNNKLPITNHETLLFSIAEYDCKRCINMFKRYHNSFLPTLFLAICKRMDFVKMKHFFVGKDLLDIGCDGVFPKCDILLPDVNESTNYFYNCVLYASKRDNINKKDLFEYISYHYVINHFDTLKIICEPRYEIVINNVTSLSKFYNNEMLRFLVPLCTYNIQYFSHVVNQLHKNKENSQYLLKLIVENVDIYYIKVIELLLEHLVLNQDIDPCDMMSIVKFASKYGTKNTLIKLLDLIDNDMKLLLVSKSYDHKLSDKLGFLNETKELNMLSIKEANEKLFSSVVDDSVYVDKLSVEEHLQAIVDTENLYVKTELLYKIKNENVDITNCKHLVKKIIDWIMDNGSYGDIYENFLGLVYSTNLNLDYKLLFVPAMYKYGKTSKLIFLGESKELNILSVKEAMKENRNKFIFVNHLTNKEIFPFILEAVNSNNSKLCRVLIQKIVCNNLQQYDTNYKVKDNMTIYKQTQHMLPDHYVYNDDSYTDEDENVVCKYKLKIDDKVLIQDYVMLLLKIDPNCYCKIFDKFIDALYEKVGGRRDTSIIQSHDIAYFMVTHEKFNLVRPSRVIALLRLYSGYNISDTIIKTHKFFEQFA
jgi:hypothetical protein